MVVTRIMIRSPTLFVIFGLVVVAIVVMMTRNMERAPRPFVSFGLVVIAIVLVMTTNMERAPSQMLLLLVFLLLGCNKSRCKHRVCFVWLADVQDNYCPYC